MKKGKLIVLTISLFFIINGLTPAFGIQIKNTMNNTSEEKDDLNSVELYDTREDNINDNNFLNPPPHTSPSDSWWNPDWSYRKEITIDHSLVDDTLVNFPVLVTISSDDNLSDTAQCQVDGDDIAFTDVGGNQLAHEIELFDNDTGELLAWVKIPSLSGSVNTSLYLYYGNPIASSQEDIENVWDSDFTLVQHLDETSGTHYDSTSYDNDGTLGGDTYTNVSQDAVGMIDGADSFNGTDGHINCGTDSGLEPGTDDFTFEAWVKRASISNGYNAIVAKRHSNTVGYIWWLTNTNSLRFFSKAGADSIDLHYSSIADTNWHHLAVTLDRDGNGVVYKDGASVGSLDISTKTGSITSTQLFSIGQQTQGVSTFNQPFDGTIDEVRVSKTPRNSSWIKTEYNNHQYPGLFHDKGPVEVQPSAPIVSNPVPIDAAIDVSLSLSQLNFNLSHKAASTMDYWVETSPDIGSDSDTGVSNGTYSVSVSGLSYETTYTWYVNVTDGTYDINETYTFTTEKAPATWWNSDWNYRKEISIDYTKVDANLTDFPVLISLTSDGDLSNDAKCQNDGDDIAFADYNGNKLPHEIVTFNGTTGELLTWVKVTSLSSTENTKLFLYYGNPGASSQEDVENVWDSDFTLVQHLDETSGTHYDSTSYSNDGTLGGDTYTNVSQTAVGMIDGADSFNGTDGHINCGTDSGLEPGTDDFTFEAWVKRASISTGNYHIIVGKRAFFGVGYIWWITNTNSLRFYSSPTGGTIDLNYGSTITDTNWHHVAVTLDRDGNGVMYKDGTSVGSQDISTQTGSITSTQFFSIGQQMNGATGIQPFDGTIDEVRVSKTWRNSSWIKTEYNNQLNPTAFRTIGLEEPKPPIPIVFKPSPADSAVDISLSLPQLKFNLSHGNGISMDYWVETSPNIGSGSATGVGNGTYSVSVSGLAYDTVYSWFVNVTDGIYDTNITYTFTTEQVPIPWWDNEWAYRRQINVDHALVDGDLTGFPVLISFNSDVDLANDSKCQDDGDDIVFTNESGVVLPHEIELFDDATGQLVAWVNVSYLSSSVDTVLFMYYGNPSCGSQEDAGGVWDGNYTMVQHLNETSGLHYDSTSFGNDGTSVNDVNQSGIGIIDGADTFGLDEDYVDCGSDTDLEPGTGDFTIEMWIKRVALSGTIGHFIIAKRSTDGYGMWMSKSSSLDQIRFYAVVSGGPIDFQGGSITDFNWHHVALTLDRGGNAVIYKDGTPVATTDISSLTSSISSANPCTIGNNGASTWDHDGTIDEVRISNAVRSSDWIGTSYNNQNNPGGFYSVLDEEVTSGPVVFDPVPVHDAIRVDVALSLLSFNLSHKDGTLMDYSVETTPNIGSDTASGVGNGTYSISISGLTIDTVYTWFVNVSDGSYDVNKTFVFTTEPPNSPPVVSSPIPADEQTDVPLSVDLSVYVSDVDLDSMDVTFMTNATGSWQVIGSNTSVGDGRYAQSYTFPDYNTLYYWSANVSDGSLWVNNTYKLTIMVEPGVWDIDCLYRKKIIIDSTMIPSDLNNFPLLIDITDSDLKNKAQNDGDDIRFTDHSGVILSHEIEYYDDSDGHLVAWVKIDSLSSSVDTTLYMYYGNSDCDSQEDVEGVWDSNFQMVQHLDETSGTHYDSTVNDNDGTPYNGVNQSGIGIIDGCDTYDATDDYVDCGYDSGLEPGTGDFTIETWIKRLDFGTHHSILSKRTGTSDGYGFWIEDENELRFYAKPVGSSINMQAGSITNSNWYYAVVTLDRDGNAVLYLDGSPTMTIDISTKTGSITTSQLFAFGAQFTTGVQQPMNGSLDEVRLSDVVRSSDWIGTCYDNQLNPGSFYSFHSEEASAIPIIYNPIPIDGATNVAIDLSTLNFSLVDYQGDLLDYWVETVPNIGSDSNTGVGNGTYNVPIVSTSPNTFHKWFVNVTDGTHWKNNTYSFTTQDFPPSYSATAYNRTVINLTSISGAPGTDSIMIRYKEFDSSQGWPYKKEIAIENATDGYQMLIRVHKNDGYDNPITGIIDCEGHCNDDFSDIRFLNAAQDTELPYWIENITEGEFANIWVKTNGESTLYMLYGYKNAVSESDGSATFYFFEDFSRSKAQLEATGLWYQCGGTAFTSNGILYWTGGPGGVFHTTHQPFKFNMTFRFRAFLKNEQLPDENGQSVAAFDPMFPESGGTNHYFDMLGSWYGQLPKYQVCFGGGGHVPNTPGVGFDCQQFSTGWPEWQTYEITRLHNHTYARNVDVGEELDSTLVIPRDSNLGVTSCTVKYGMKSEADWFLLRMHSDLEPTWSSFETEEPCATFPSSQFPANINDGVLLMNSTASSYDHVNLGFGTVYCYSAWAYNTTYDVWSSKVDRVAVTHANQVPMLTNEFPTDGAGGVNPDISSVNIEISDPDGDIMNWIIEVSNGDQDSMNEVSDGKIYCYMTSSLEFLTAYTWDVKVTDGHSWTNRTYTFTTGPQPGPWFNETWLYRKYIFIDYTKVVENSDLYNFPVLISFDADSDLASHAQDDGDDIFFTDYDGNKLYHEIELFDDGTGQLVAWVNVTTLSSTEDTLLYMYYGNGVCDSQENITDVWSNHYMMVQHLNETSGTHYDSTINDNDGSPQNGVNQNGLGLIDGCDNFDANDDYIDCGTGSSLNPGTGDYTLEAWVKRDSIGTDHAIFCKRAGYPGVGFLFWIQNSDNVRLYVEDSLSHSASIVGGSVPCCGWHHIVVTLDRDDSGTIYIDGSPVISQDITGLTSSIDPTKLLALGSQITDSGQSLPFDGNIDEARVSDIARSQGWIATSFNNQNNPSSFCPVIGVEELVPQEPFVFNPSPTQGDMNVPISTTKLSFTLTDYQNDLMNYTVETIPNIGSDSANNVGNGVYTVIISGLSHNTSYTWYVNATDGTHWAKKIYHFTVEPMPGPWWNLKWPYRKSIIINKDNVASKLTNFPVLINIIDSNLASKSNYHDIAFTSYNGIKLDHEIEIFNITSGELIAWIKIPILSNTTNTIIYMYYGSSSSGQENSAGTWGNSYALVHHLDETTLIHFDSSQYGNHGTITGAVDQDSVGIIDGDDYFAGTTGLIDIPAHSSHNLPNELTVTMWIKPGKEYPSSKWGVLLNRQQPEADDSYLFAINDAGKLHLGSSGGNIQSTKTSWDADTWYYVAGTYRNDLSGELYIDGIFEPLSVDNFDSMSSVNRNIEIGGAPGWSYNENFMGDIDEVHISSVTRNSSWIYTEYLNQYDPSSFSFIGNEESTDAPIITDPVPSDGAQNIPVSISELIFNLSDINGDPIDYTVETSPDIGSDSDTGVSNGTYSVSVSGLAYDTVYTWFVNATDPAGSGDWTNVTFMFTTIRNIPSVTDVKPADNAMGVMINPTLQAYVSDPQDDQVDWMIRSNVTGLWNTLNSGVLIGGNGTISSSTSNMDEEGKTYYWSINVTDSTGSGEWVNNTYTFTTFLLPDVLSFAAFSDTHVGSLWQYPGWGNVDNLDLLGQDVTNRTGFCKFAINLGDITNHNTAQVHGIGLPAQVDQYRNNLKACHISNLNLPLHVTTGNHDVNDYELNSNDPHNLTKSIIDELSMNTLAYSMMRDGILFISIPELGYVPTTHPVLYEYIEYMTDLYPDTTTIIFSHQAIEDTTAGGSGDYRGKSDMEFWSSLFQNNSQIKMFVHGHNHRLSWYLSDQSSGSTHPVYDFGHDIAFSAPYSQTDFGTYHEEDRIVIYNITEDDITTKAWDHNGAEGYWVSEYDHTFTVDTTYDPDAEDWYSIPVFLQDNETQLFDMKVLSPEIEVQLVGTQPMELGYDPEMESPDGWANEIMLSFGDDRDGNVGWINPGMKVWGPKTITFPEKNYHGAPHEDGRSGQPYEWVQMGTISAAVPGQTYNFTITAKSESGTGNIRLLASCSDWGTETQYSTLSGSTAEVFNHTFGSSFETFSGTYTVPNDNNAWFLQGDVEFINDTIYEVSLFSVKRERTSDTSDDFSLYLSGNWYNNTGTLNRFDMVNFSVDPRDLSDSEGVINFTALIDGNQYGMARLIYHEPVLLSRNARFRVNDITDVFNITLTKQISRYSSVFKMFPFNYNYNNLEIQASDASGEKHYGANGRTWVTCNTPSSELDVEVAYGYFTPVVSEEYPGNDDIHIPLNPTLSVDVQDLQGDNVDWMIRSNAGGSWSTLDSGTLIGGIGTISTSTSNMNNYNTLYQWSVNVTDSGGSGKWTNKTYHFTTRPENFEPVVSNPYPTNNEIDIPLTTVLSIDVSDGDGDSMDVTFMTNAIGSWQIIGTNNSVGNGTYQQTFTFPDYNSTYHWSVNVTDSKTWTNKTYMFKTELEPGVWFDDAWRYRKEIDIDHTMIDVDLSYFPILINITDDDLASKAQDDGDDIFFTDYYNRLFSHEIEFYDNISGHLITWVNISSLSSSEDTVLYMYYGNSICDSQENPGGVWRSEFVMVHHLSETTGLHYDSTVNDNDGTALSGVDQDAVGMIDGCDEFDDTSLSFVNVGTDSSMDIFGHDNDFSIMLWVKRDDLANLDSFFSSGSSSTKGVFFGSKFDDRDEIRFMSPSSTVDVYSSGNDLDDYDWHMLVLTADRDGYMRLWVDAGVAASQDISLRSGENWNRQDDTYKVGTDRSESNPMNGLLDEVRLYNGVLSDEWITLSYNNQLNPSNYYNIGLEQLPGNRSVVLTNPSPSDDATGILVGSLDLSIYASDPDGDLMNVVFMTNASGSWQVIGTNSSVVNGTYQQTSTFNDYNRKYWWSVNTTDPVGSGDWTNKSYCFTTMVPLSSWSHRKKIVIDHLNIDSDLVNFPVLIQFNEDTDLATFAQNDFDDILFTDDSVIWGTGSSADRLHHEIEEYSSVDGNITVWVNVTLVSSTVDTVLYMYFGNPSSDNMQNPPEVWDTNYVMIQHLNETSGTHYDSTIYNNDGTNYGSIQDYTGIIDGGNSYDGIDDHVRIPDDSSIQFDEGSFTAEAWIYPESIPDAFGARIINNRGTGMGGDYKGHQLKIADSTGKWKIKDAAIDDGNSDYKDYEGSSTYAYNDWYHMVMVYEADNQLRFYVDGILDGTLGVGSYGDISNSLPTAISGSIAHNGVEGADNKQFFDGVIDEVRLSDVVRDSAWIKACYINQNDPSAFYGVFSHPGPKITLIEPVNNSEEVSPVNFSYIPECFSPGGGSSAELWFNLTETYDGSLHYSTGDRPQRGVIKDKKLYVLEGGKITIREFPNGTILRQGSTFGASHTNTAPYVLGDKVYGMNTAGRMQCYNETTGTAEWTVNVCTALQSNSFEYHDGYFYVESTNFTLHKVDVTDGSADDMFELNYAGSNSEKAHPLIDYENDRLYALGNSKYHCIDLTTFTEIWNTTIVTNGGRDTRAGPILVNDSHSGQYLTIFSTFPQVGTYAVDFDGVVVWTWTTKTIRAHAAYNPNTGLIYLADASGYSDAGGSLPVPGNIYGVYVNNGTTKWVTQGTGGGDKFARPITTSGNYIIWKTDNTGKNDSLYVGDATTGETLAKISAEDDRGYWCYPCALSGGYVATGGGYTSGGQAPGTDIYHIGDGEWVDSYPLHGNVNHTGYVENGLTSLGFTTETWEVRKVNDTPIVNNSLNEIEYDFSVLDLPKDFTWNIKLIQSDGQSAWGDDNWNVRVTPMNHSPDISSPSPDNGAANIPLSLSELSVNIDDPEDDLFNWSIETSPGIGSSSALNGGDGIKTCSISGLQLDTVYTWFVNATDAGSDEWTRMVYQFSTPELLSGWLYRKEIVIDHSLVDDDLVNFPVLIQLDADSDLALHAQSDFDDILFTNDSVDWISGSSTEKLSHEIETYDSVVGNLTVWVNVTYLSSSVGTVLYMYYGNGECGNQEDVEGTWNSDFALVQHLSETSGTHYDSTVNDNDGTCSGVNQDAVGMIDGGDSFDGVDNLIDISADSSHNLPNDLSLSMWLKPDVTYDSGLSDYLVLLNRQQPEVDDSYMLAINSDGRLHLGSSGGNIQSTQNSWSSGSWYHVAGTYHSSSGEMYVNGASEPLSVNNYDTMSSVDRNIEIGGVSGYGDFYDGVLDEVRIYNKALSSGWFSTEYNNQFDPDSFYSIGLQESIAGEPLISNEVPVDGATDVERQPTLSVYIADAQGDSINVQFRSNVSGSWQNLCSYIGVGNGTQTCSNTGSMNSYNHLYWWSVNATDPLGTGDWTNHTYRFTTLSMPGPWFNTSWMYRRKIVINHSLVDDDLFNFTALIDITDSNVSDSAQADGDDLVFTSYDGDQHNHEIEFYNNTNGHLIAWVKVPFLSSSVDTILYLYYGNPVSLNMENISGTWDEFFKMVQHLNETSGIHYDSTVYGNDGTNFGSNQDYIGVIDHGNSFDGSSDYIRVPTDDSIQFDEGNFTAETWIKPNTGNTNSRIINTRGKGAGGAVKGWQLKIGESAGKWKLKDTAIDDDSGSYKAYESTNTYSYNGWYHIVMVYDADNELRFYVNGVSDGSLSVGSYGNISNGLPTAIGASIATNGVEGTYDQYYNGGMDEIRLSNITRSSGWITTEYNNQFVPDSFFDIGDVEIVQIGDTIPPEIISLNLVSSSPIDVDPVYGWENITVTVTDDVSVDEVKLNITYPDSSTTNVSMLPLGGGLYYYNTTYTMIGDYSYFVWADDTSSNSNVSSTDIFQIPPNWDIEMDGVCGLSDLSKVSIKYEDTGPNGWVREDVDNDGVVGLSDLSKVSIHYEDTWP